MKHTMKPSEGKTRKDFKHLTLKNVKFHEDMSEETACFSALLVDNGVIVAHVKNEGRGGGNTLYHYDTPKGGNLGDLYEKYGDLDAECHILTLAEEWNIVARNQRNALVLLEGENKYSTVGFKGKSITQMKKMVGYKHWIKNQVKQWEDRGFTVLNRNL